MKIFLFISIFAMLFVGHVHFIIIFMLRAFVCVCGKQLILSHFYATFMLSHGDFYRTINFLLTQLSASSRMCGV